MRKIATDLSPQCPIREIREIRGAIPFFAPFAPFRGKSTEAPFHEPFTT